AYDALVMVDDCHATGFLGPKGRGSAAWNGVEGKIDIVTGTFGKALGGAMGGFVCARKEVVELLRQRTRRYLFSDAPPPAVGGALGGGRGGHPDRRGGGGRCPTPAPVRQRGALPRRHGRGRVQPAGRRAPDHPGDAGRR